MRRAALLVAVLLCPVLGARSVAWAGTYQVTACDRAPADQNNSWQLFNTDIAHLVTGSVCPPSQAGGEQAKATGVYTTDSLTGTGSAATGASAGWTFTAPPSTSIVAFQPDRYLGAYGDNGWIPSITASGTTLESCTFSFPQDECAVGEPFGNVNSLGGVLQVNDATTLTVGITCTGAEGCVPGATIHHAWAALYGATVTLSETTKPTFTSVGGVLWEPGLAGGFHKGTETVSFAATDPTGISQVTLSLDGQPIATATGVCEYTYAIPCQPLAGTLALNTTQFPDGAHTLTLTALDAAHNESQVTHAITIANNPPPPPVGLLATRQANGLDTVTWANPAHVAPIVGADYQLCPLPGGSCGAPVSVTDTGRLEGIDPPPGSWEVRVWLADAAGNVNLATAASAPLPALLRVGLHHKLKGRRLVASVVVPAGAGNSVTVSYNAQRGRRTVAHARKQTTAKHGRARLVFRLSGAARRAGKLDITASATGTLPRTIVVTLHRPSH
jgi:hypothetical protein